MSAITTLFPSQSHSHLSNAEGTMLQTHTVTATPNLGWQSGKQQQQHHLYQKGNCFFVFFNSSFSIMFPAVYVHLWGGGTERSGLVIEYWWGDQARVWRRGCSLLEIHWTSLGFCTWNDTKWALNLFLSQYFPLLLKKRWKIIMKCQITQQLLQAALYCKVKTLQ